MNDVQAGVAANAADTTGIGSRAQPVDLPVIAPIVTGPRARWRGVVLSESIVSGLVGVADGLGVALVGLVGCWLWVGFGNPNVGGYGAAIAVQVGLTVSAFHRARLYEFETIVAWPGRMRLVVLVGGMVGLGLVTLAFAVKISEQFSRLWFFSSVVGAAVMICAARGLVKYLIRRWAAAGLLVRNVAIVGASGQARYLVARLKRRDAPWKRVVGVFDDRRTRIGREIDGCPVLGNLDDLVRYVRQGRIHDVVVTLPWSADARLVGIIAKLRVLPVHVYLGSDLIGYHFPRYDRRLLEGIPVLEIASTPLTGWSGLIKLIEDKAVAGLLLALFAPPMLAIALLIKLDSPGPVLFRQARFGFNNEVIVVHKFRTMRHRPPEPGAPQARRDDPRVTRVGRWLRRTSLDELPQLLDVLRGAMSLVGPRPHAVEHNEQYAALIGGYHGRHKVKPGITGWAQVNGLRGETASVDQMRARVEHDIYYIEHWSPWFDLKILLMTALFGWIHKNAY